MPANPGIRIISPAICIVFAFSMMTISCGSGTVIPPQTGTQPQTTDWKADVMIVPNEYTASQLVDEKDSFTINWKTDGQNIFVGMQTRTMGYIAVGILQAD